MQDFYLKFVDEEQAQSVLYTKVVDEWSEPEDPDVEPIPLRWHYVPNYVNIDTIGVIYEPAPDPVTEGYVPVLYDGWFVNVRVVSEDPEPLLTFSIDPQPYQIRIWA
jgi:hypothetical protein